MLKWQQQQINIKIGSLKVTDQKEEVDLTNNNSLGINTLLLELRPFFLDAGLNVLVFVKQQKLSILYIRIPHVGNTKKS